MPTQTPGEIIIAGTGTIYHGPEGITLPSHLTDALDPDFLAVGFTTDDGAKFTDEKTTNQVRPWQSFYPVRTHITERSATVEATLLQWNEPNMILAYGGGGITEPQPGEYRYHPPAPEELAIVAIVIDFTDGDKEYRFCAGRCFVTSNTETTWAKTGPALLPITFEILAPEGAGDPWTIDSNDPAFAPLAS